MNDSPSLNDCDVDLYNSDIKIENELDGTGSTDFQNRVPKSLSTHSPLTNDPTPEKQTLPNPQT